VPIAPQLVKELMEYRSRCYPTDEGWLFANPATGKPYHQEEIQKKHIRRAARAAAIESQVGWKTFRHSFRSWLDQTDAPIGVPRELMRHASIQTTMNVYGRAMTDSKRQAHSNVVQMVLQVETADAVVEEKPESLVNMV
jgi:integrase